MSEVTDALDALVTKYEAQRSVDVSARTLLSGLAQQVKDAAASIDANNAANSAAKAKLTEIATTVEADTAEMAAAISANTPAVPSVP